MCGKVQKVLELLVYQTFGWEGRSWKWFYKEGFKGFGTRGTSVDHSAILRIKGNSLIKLHGGPGFAMSAKINIGKSWVLCIVELPRHF